MQFVQLSLPLPLFLAKYITAPYRGKQQVKLNLNEKSYKYELLERQQGVVAQLASAQVSQLLSYPEVESSSLSHPICFFFFFLIFLLKSLLTFPNTLNKPLLLNPRPLLRLPPPPNSLQHLLHRYQKWGSKAKVSVFHFDFSPNLVVNLFINLFTVSVHEFRVFHFDFSPNLVVNLFVNLLLYCVLPRPIVLCTNVQSFNKKKEIMCCVLKVDSWVEERK